MELIIKKVQIMFAVLFEHSKLIDIIFTIFGTSICIGFHFLVGHYCKENIKNDTKDTEDVSITKRRK